MVQHQGTDPISLLASIPKWRCPFLPLLVSSLSKWNQTPFRWRWGVPHCNALFLLAQPLGSRFGAADLACLPAFWAANGFLCISERRAGGQRLCLFQFPRRAKREAPVIMELSVSLWCPAKLWRRLFCVLLEEKKKPARQHGHWSQPTCAKGQPLKVTQLGGEGKGMEMGFNDFWQILRLSGQNRSTELDKCVI